MLYRMYAGTAGCQQSLATFTKVEMLNPSMNRMWTTNY